MEKIDRLEYLLRNIGEYLYELDDEFRSAEHSKACFGMTEEEHMKYMLGKKTANFYRDFYYIYNEDKSELEVYIVGLNDCDYILATISDVDEKDCDRLTKEVLDELGYIQLN